VTGSYRIYHFLWGSLDWLFPPVCGGCNKVGFRWCPECQQQVQVVPEPVCFICGLPQSRPGLCALCSDTHPSYKILRSWLVFEGPIRRALHTLKFRRNVSLGEALARSFSKFVIDLDWPFELVVPVPSSRRRMTERGYNQVALVARPLAAIMGKQFSPKSLIRARESRSQVGLSPAQRKENVSGAFRAGSVRVEGRNILIVDDIATTGATLESCARALQQAGARDIYALTLARALPRHGFQIV
jgi:competence protein ComFC